MNNPTIYKAWLSSRCPNSLCEVCSYFKPKWYYSDDGVYDPRRFSDVGVSEICWSCGNSCEKVFLPENQSLERVPDSYVTGMPHNLETLLKRGAPKLPRTNWYDRYWQDFYEKNVKKKEESAPKNKQKEPEFKVIRRVQAFKSSGKKAGRKLKVGGLFD